MKPLIINLIRNLEMPDATLGVLRIPDFDKNFFTLENGKRVPKVKGETRIPEGVYELKLRFEGGFHKRYSEIFKEEHPMIWLQDVPDFRWIYFHIGNWVKDTDGCILLGNEYEVRYNLEGHCAPMILNSTDAYLEFYRLIAPVIRYGTPAFLNVIDTGCAYGQKG